MSEPTKVRLDNSALNVRLEAHEATWHPIAVKIVDPPSRWFEAFMVAIIIATAIGAAGQEIAAAIRESSECGQDERKKS